MLKRIVVLYFLLGICFGTYGQFQELKHLNVENGLSNNFVIDIVQDGQGFIWIATESGLNRFDGKNFTTFTKKNSAIISNELNALLYDHEENSIWAGSQRDGISIFNCNTQSFTNLTVEDGLITNDITHLSHAVNGEGIWITNYHIGIGYYDKKTKKIIRFISTDIEGLKSRNWVSCDDGKGNLYVGHDFDGLSIVDIKNKTARNLQHDSENPGSLPGNTVRVITIDSQKNIWIGTNNGLALLNSQTDECITFRHDPSNPNSLGSNYIYDICEMNDGTLWITTDMAGISILDLNQITLIDPQKVKFRNLDVINSQDGLSSSNVRTLFQDSFGNIWMGHYKRGIDFIANKSPAFRTLLSSIGNHRDLKEKQIWDITLDNNQRLWIGSENEVISLENNQISKIIDIKKYLSKVSSNVQVNKISCDKNGMIWFGTTMGELFQLNPENYKVKNIPFGLHGEYINTFYAEDNGTMWVGTENGLYSNRIGVLSRENQINEQLRDKIIYSILRDLKGRLWVGTLGQGIYIFDQNYNLIENIVKEKGFVSNAINHLFIDSEGGVWAATRNGIVYFENRDNGFQYKVYDEKQGLENSFVRAIQEDKQGDIWISTNVGISRWSANEMKFNNYNYQDGTSFGDYTNGSVCMNDEGTVFFGSLNGICMFNPEEITKEQPRLAPVQIIECVALYGQIENESNEILTPNSKHKVILPYDKNTFRVSFSNPDFSQNLQVEYACMMEGMDNSWYNTQGDNQVTYRNMSPGEYTFKVKSRLKNLEWDETNIASLTFVVHPPLWLTWYAKSLYVMLIFLLIYFILRSYKRKLKLKTSLELERKENQNKLELNNERLQFYTNITHELRTPLTLILGPLDDLVQDSNLPAAYSKKISLIHASGIRLLNLINQILEFRKTETQNRRLAVTKGNLANLVFETATRYKELNRNDKVSFHIDIDNNNTLLYYDADIITTILNNLLSNAIKYTPEGEIRISLHTFTEKEKRYTEILVSDTGYGIDNEALSHIFERYYQGKGKFQASGTGIGLALVKSLADLHEGVLGVESEMGKGTTFSFRLLTDNSYPSAIHIETKKEEKTVDNVAEEEKIGDSRSIVLVIEDDDDIRNYILTSLEKDYEVITATNGREGLELANKHIPNIIVSDIMMPIMNGIELCSNIKADMRTSHIPVILLTAKDAIHDKELGYESGADSYLTKPFSSRLLKSRIYNLLENRRKIAEQISAFTNGTASEVNESTEIPSVISKLDEEFLKKLTEIIENNIEDDHLDIDFIKDKLNMSYSTFYRKVKGLTGISPNEFLRKIRLKKSVSLLLTGSYQVSEVAYMSGFNDVVYYRKCFKEEFGLSPSEYMKTIK